MLAERQPDDPPASDEIAIANSRSIPSFVVGHHFLARASDGTIVGVGEAIWTETADNQHIVSSYVAVLPPHRGHGIARALFRHVVETAERVRRPLLVGWTDDRVPAGSAFARHLGGVSGQEGHTNRLLLADVDRAMVQRWLDEGPLRAPGYSLISVDGPYPIDLVQAITNLHHVMNTAPRDDFVEEHDVTVEEIRESEKGLVASGTTRWYIAARHDATGELVGFTELFWNPKDDPRSAWQGGTAVRPEQRGHALGKWLKAANLQRVFEELPQITNIRTYNADSNDAMLGINNALGFRPFYATISWQLPVEKAREYLDAR